MTPREIMEQTAADLRELANKIQHPKCWVCDHGNHPCNCPEKDNPQ